MLLAARELHGELGRLLRAYERKGAGAWDEEVRYGGRAPRTRHVLAPASGLVQAVRVYAERATLERNRKYRGMVLGKLALAAAQGTVKDAEILKQARAARGDRLPIGEVRGEVDRARGKRSKWRAAYNMLAMDADVWPVPDTRRGLRGQLEALYTYLVRSKA
jgi:hypothetical protein